MIDPIIFTINIGGLALSLSWYGALVMVAVISAALLTAHGFKQRGQDPEYVWDSLLYVLPTGFIGARVWYVLNVILGGDLHFVHNPLSIFNLKQGGFHYFGALLFGALAAYLYAKKMGVDFWLALDAVAPGLLLGQAMGRPANFVNQELYGQPTSLPWGIPISAGKRIPPWHNLALYPEETTRFHPTFAYEMLWNIFATVLLLSWARKHQNQMKPGIIFSAWLVLAGTGRNIIEFFRPDQPTFPGTAFSYSRFVAILMIITGILLILIKCHFLRIKGIPAGPDAYRIAPSLEDRRAAGRLNQSTGDDVADEKKPPQHNGYEGNVNSK